MGTTLGTTVTSGIPIDERTLYVRLFSHMNRPGFTGESCV